MTSEEFRKKTIDLCASIRKGIQMKSELPNMPKMTVEDLEAALLITSLEVKALGKVMIKSGIDPSLFDEYFINGLELEKRRQEQLLGHVHNKEIKL